MRVIKFISGFVLFLAMAYGCVFPYEIDFKSADDILVVNGHVTDREGYHYIEISRTANLSNPDRFIPVFKCMVTLQDDEGNVFTATESSPGKYACWIDGEYLTHGTQFQLAFTTQDGKEYVSDYDELLACPPIDSVHWSFEEVLTDDPDRPFVGIQFYVSTDASGYTAKYFRWAVNETWEYRTPYMTKAYWDGRRIVEPEEESDSLNICYISVDADEVFIYSAQDLASGQIREYPLIYVTNQSDKLSHRYSLLVRQMSLTPEAHEYWGRLEDQSKQSGELYETQPVPIGGNIHSLDDDEERVMGIFYASSIQERRITVKPYMYTLPPSCYAWGLEGRDFAEALRSYPRDGPPIYLLEVSPGTYDLANQSCFDCRIRGGSLQLPSIWQ